MGYPGDKANDRAGPLPYEWSRFERARDSMEAEIQAAEINAPLEILMPERQSLPLVVASPHSGSTYPPDFVAASRLDRLTLRRSEDCFVHDLFEQAPRLGAPLIRALFPRAFIDPNREPFELDPAMFHDELPAYVNTRSPRVAAGLGTLARVVANGAEIYRRKLSFAEAMERLRGCYWPYHQAMRRLLDETLSQFHYCVLIDCHSMPSVGGPTDSDTGLSRVDFVLGDNHGAACAPAVTDIADEVLSGLGYNVTRNAPYSGGFITRHYGRPAHGVHALQIEINRALYMDEERILRGPNLPKLAEDMGRLIAVLGEIEPVQLEAA